VTTDQIKIVKSTVMKNGVIVLVTGGRSYADMVRVFSTLDDVSELVRIRLLIEGGAGERFNCGIGADALAYRWAAIKDVPRLTVPAQWSEHGPSAGPRRNLNMAFAQPDLGIAFPGGSGTADMVRKLEACGTPILRIS
jgi:hypothetical protein